MKNKGGQEDSCRRVLIWGKLAIEVYLSFHFAVVFHLTYFRFRHVQTNFKAISMSRGKAHWRGSS
jgi:hypothetical protein